MAVTGISHVFGRDGMKGGQKTVRTKQRRVEGTVKGRRRFPLQFSKTPRPRRVKVELDFHGRRSVEKENM